MKTTHTPGPWQIFWNYGDCDVHRIHNGQSADISETICAVNAFAPTDGDMEAEGKANARLIAAAPELLAELIQLRANIAAEGWELAPSAAIAKATGEQP